MTPPNLPASEPQHNDLETDSLCTDLGSDPPCPWSLIHYNLKGKPDPKSALVFWDLIHMAPNAHSTPSVDTTVSIKVRDRVNQESYHKPDSRWPVYTEVIQLRYNEFGTMVVIQWIVSAQKQWHKHCGETQGNGCVNLFVHTNYCITTIVSNALYIRCTTWMCIRGHWGANQSRVIWTHSPHEYPAGGFCTMWILVLELPVDVLEGQAWCARNMGQILNLWLL